MLHYNLFILLKGSSDFFEIKEALIKTLENFNYLHNIREQLKLKSVETLGGPSQKILVYDNCLSLSAESLRNCSTTKYHKFYGTGKVHGGHFT